MDATEHAPTPGTSLVFDMRRIKDFSLAELSSLGSLFRTRAPEFSVWLVNVCNCELARREAEFAEGSPIEPDLPSLDTSDWPNESLAGALESALATHAEALDAMAGDKAAAEFAFQVLVRIGAKAAWRLRRFRPAGAAS